MKMKNRVGMRLGTLMSLRKNPTSQAASMVLHITWALVSEFGCPHVFITLTCNPIWPKIISRLLDKQTAFDHPDVTAVVFKSRLDQLEMNLRNGKYFDGHELIYSFHVIEYQYCDLPHAHLVARLKDAPDISDQNNKDLINFVDSHFKAELPRFEGEEHQTIYTNINWESEFTQE